MNGEMIINSRCFHVINYDTLPPLVLLLESFLHRCRYRNASTRSAGRSNAQVSRTENNRLTLTDDTCLGVGWGGVG